MVADGTSESAVFQRHRSLHYPTMVRGLGRHVWDSADNRYLDLASGSSATTTIGYGRQSVADAMRDQALKMPFAHTARFTNEPQEALAGRLSAMAPPGVSSVMFTSGGSEANELALRIARLYHLGRGDARRWKVLAFEPGYHGPTFGSMSVSGQPAFREPFDPYLMPAVSVPFPLTVRGPLSGLDPDVAALRAAEDLRAIIEETDPTTISAFIVEPISATTGTSPAPADYWIHVRALCDEFGILLIADEVLTGMGRTGEFLSLSHYGVVADISTIGKGLGAGYAPIAAALLHNTVTDSLERDSVNIAALHTYGGNPIACATAIAVLDVIETEDLIRQAEAKGQVLDALIEAELAEMPLVAGARGIGLMRAVEYHDAGTDQSSTGPGLGARLVFEMEKKGVLVTGPRASGAHGREMTNIYPPLNVTEVELAVGVTALRRCLEEMA